MAQPDPPLAHPSPSIFTATALTLNVRSLFPREPRLTSAHHDVMLWSHCTGHTPRESSAADMLCQGRPAVAGVAPGGFTQAFSIIPSAVNTCLPPGTLLTSREGSRVSWALEQGGRRGFHTGRGCCVCPGLRPRCQWQRGGCQRSVREWPGFPRLPSM